jgi:FYVE/RhoGEF/PH domain-containing protein 5/6
MEKSLISAMNKLINALDDLLKRIQHPKNGVSIEDRKYHLRIYPQTFIGRELVDWFLSNKIFVTREDAVAFGKVLVERGVIRHCTQAHDFKDEYLFYVILPAFQLTTLLQKETERLLSERRTSRYDGNNVQIGSKKNEAYKVRCFKIQELIDTEKSYLRSLNIAITNYRLTLANSSDLMTEAKLKQIFGNIEEIIMTSHSFLRTLYKNIPDDFSEAICIGQIFLDFAPHWSTYATYAHKHQDAIALMLELEHKKDPVITLIKAIRDDNDISDIMSLLIQPVQRIPRYRLLLEDIDKKTPDDHPDKESLNKAIKSVDGVAVLVNESIRDYEALKNVDRVLKQFGYPKELDDVHLEGSKVLAEGWLAKVTRRGPTVRRFVVISIPKSPAGGAIYYARASLQPIPTRASAQFTLTAVRKLAVGTYFAQAIPPTKDVQNAFKLLGKGKSFVCIATSEAEKNMWITAFNQLAKDDAQTSFAPVWIGDDHSSACLRCNKPFSALSRRHHCRNCGILVCHKCSSNKAIVKSVHPTTPTRVCDNCFDILEGALAAAGQNAGRVLGAFVFDDDDNDDESDFERLKWSSEDIRENLMKSAAVMVQRLALTMNENQPPSGSPASTISTPRQSSTDKDEERRVLIRKSTSTDSEDLSNSDSTPSSSRNSADLGVSRARSSHVLIPTGQSFQRIALLTPTTSEDNSPASTPDTKSRSWLASEADANPGKRRTGFFLTRGRSSGEVTGQGDDVANSSDST